MPQVMTTKINDGGPAFPCTNEQFTHGNATSGDAHSGMTLRDYFAGQAIVGIIGGRKVGLSQVVAEDAAESAYAIADAMLAARGGAS